MASKMKITRKITLKKVLTIKKDLKIGSPYPWGYGLAYYNIRETTDDEQTGVCYPIPLNWIIAFLRSIYFRLQWHPFFFKNDPIKIAYDKGVRKGREITQDSYIIQNLDEIRKEIDDLSNKVRPFCLETVKDIIENQSPVRMAIDDDTFDQFDSLTFPENHKGKGWTAENLVWEFIKYSDCIIYPEPTLTVLKQLTGLSIIVGIRVDNSIYIEGLILAPKEKI